MARRFGRNQKRAFRNQLALQEKLLEKHIGIIAERNGELHKANEIINLTAEILGEHFISLPVQTSEVKEIQDHYQFAAKNSSRYWANDVKLAFVEQALCHLETYQADAHIDELSGAMHMAFNSVSGKVAYAISDMAWRKLSEQQLVGLVQLEVANKMAKKVVQARKNAYSPRRF